MITTKSVEFTGKDGSLKFEVASSGGLVVSCVGGQPWELTDEQTMEVYALLDQAIVADKWIGASDPSPEASVIRRSKYATVHVEPGDFGNIVVRGSSWTPPAVPRQVGGEFARKVPKL